MKFLNSIVEEKFRTAFLAFFTLSSMLPLLILVYLYFQHIRPTVTPYQQLILSTPVFYGLAAMLAVPLISFFIMSWWAAGLEKLTDKIRHKTADIMDEKIDLTDRNELAAVDKHLDRLLGELQGRIGKMNEYSERLLESKKKLARMSRIDDLTGLSNWRQFQRKLVEEVAIAEKKKQPLSLIMLDIQDFKGYNGKYGVGKGDLVLRRIGKIIREMVQGKGWPFRYGGDEFAMILPNTGVEAAAGLAQLIMETAVTMDMEKPGPEQLPARIDINCGVVSYSQDLRRMFAGADKCLEKANMSKSGQVVLVI